MQTGTEVDIWLSFRDARIYTLPPLRVRIKGRPYDIPFSDVNIEQNPASTSPRLIIKFANGTEVSDNAANDEPLFTVPAGEKIEGTVSQISGVATKNTNLDESDTKVTIKLNDVKSLRPGATINATIFYNESKNIIKIPYSAVMNENNKYYVFTVDKSNKITKKEIGIGTNDDSYYEITSGLSVGERIITVVDEALKDGDKIKIADPSKNRNSNEENAQKQSKRKKGGPGGPPM